MPVIEWVKSRLIEPTTWLAVGVAAILLSTFIPAGSDYFMGLAAVTVVAGVVMRERGNG
tara:strand:+ start:501 stop:677 length:177 start_codon:yes stop_codon:yes gene_type:complete